MSFEQEFETKVAALKQHLRQLQVDNWKNASAMESAIIGMHEVIKNKDISKKVKDDMIDLRNGVVAYREALDKIIYTLS